MMTLATTLLLAAQVLHYHGELPDETHAWSVHDLHRPNPVKVTADEGKIPSDAIFLFDGTEKSVRDNWCDKNGKPTKWKVKDGCLVCTPGSGIARTKESFGDCQLHVEWMAPADEPGHGQGRGNSGVYLASQYELQILESFGTNPANMTNPNYADGQAGALYGQHPPLVNPARPEGVWQSYDAIFHPAVWKDGKRIHPATMTAFFNGVLIHDQWELDGPTDWVVRAQPTELPYEAPLKLQDHGHPVPFRNIWIRRIPSRWADRVHGGCAVEAAAVAKQRAANAAAVAAKIEKGVCDFANAERAIEAVAYDPKGGYAATMDKVLKGLADELLKKDAAWIANPDNRDDVLCVQHLCEMMVKKGLMKEDAPICRASRAVLALRKHDPRCVFSLYIIEGAKQSGVPLAKAIDRIMAAGIKAVDVGLDEVSPAQQMVAAGMHVESVYWDVLFLDADNGEKSGDELLAAAKLLGSPRIMVLPQAFPKGADRKACMKKTIEGLRKLVAKAKAAGIVTTVEDYGSENSPCASIAQLKELFDAIPDLKFTLDAGNFYASGSKDDPLKALEMFRDRIVHCHVKDYRVGKAGVWCPLGKGCIPNEKIVRALMASGYRGYFTIEETAAPDFLKAVEDAEKCLSNYLEK